MFVAYPWRVYGNRARYKRAYTTLSDEFDVRFIFAEDKLSSRHVLQKIAGMIQNCDFGIYDVTGWNANVTLEYGLAVGLSRPTFIAFNPEKTQLDDVPSDVRGFDRLQYADFDDLNDKLRSFLQSGPELDVPLIQPADILPPLNVGLSIRAAEICAVDSSEPAASAWLQGEADRLLAPLRAEPPASDPSDRTKKQYASEVTAYLDRAHDQLPAELRARAVGALRHPLQLVVSNKTDYNFRDAVIELRFPKGLHAFFSLDQARSQSLFPTLPQPWGQERSLSSLLRNESFRPQSTPEDALIDNYDGCNVEFPPIHLRPRGAKPTRRLYVIADESLAGATVTVAWTLSARATSGIQSGEITLDVDSSLLQPVDLFSGGR